MPEYRDRHGDSIWLPGPSPYDGLFGVGAVAILILASIVLCPMFLFSECHIGKTSIRQRLFFCLVSVVVSIVMARLKFRSIIEIVFGCSRQFYYVWFILSYCFYALYSYGKNSDVDCFVSFGYSNRLYSPKHKVYCRKRNFGADYRSIGVYNYICRLLLYCSSKPINKRNRHNQSL